MRKYLLVFLIFILGLFFSSQIGLSFHPSLNLHSPILIEGNDDFTRENGVISGSGTKDDPYIIAAKIAGSQIQGWKVNNRRSNYAIKVHNTTAYFVIKNCSVSGDYIGIDFSNVQNGRIEACTISNNEIGIYLNRSSVTTIKANDIRSNGIGIRAESTHDNEISKNDIVKNGQFGIRLVDSTNNLIYLNSFERNRTHAWDNGDNQWDDGSKGNFWDDAECECFDVPYPHMECKPYKIPGDDNVDRHPIGTGKCQGRWNPFTPSPGQVNIKISVKAETFATVRIEFPSACYRIQDWGSVNRVGDKFLVDAKIEAFTGICVQVITYKTHTYPLGDLPDGKYEFVFKTWGTNVKSREFAVGLNLSKSGIFPSPVTSDTATLHLEGQFNGVTLLIFDLAGMKVLERTYGVNDADVDLSELDNGLYLYVLVVQKNGSTLRSGIKKLLIQQ